MSGLEIECCPERAPDHPGEAIGSEEVFALLGCDALRPCLAAFVPVGFGAAALLALASLAGPLLFESFGDIGGTNRRSIGGLVAVEGERVQAVYPVRLFGAGPVVMSDWGILAVFNLEVGVDRRIFKSLAVCDIGP